MKIIYTTLSHKLKCNPFFYHFHYDLHFSYLFSFSYFSKSFMFSSCFSFFYSVYFFKEFFILFFNSSSFLNRFFELVSLIFQFLDGFESSFLDYFLFLFSWFELSCVEMCYFFLDDFLDLNWCFQSVFLIFCFLRTMKLCEHKKYSQLFGLTVGWYCLWYCLLISFFRSFW